MHSKQTENIEKQWRKKNPTRWSKYLTKTEREWVKRNQHPHKTSSERSINSGHRKRHHPQNKHKKKKQTLCWAKNESASKNPVISKTKYLVIGRENWQENTDTNTHTETR